MKESKFDNMVVSDLGEGFQKVLYKDLDNEDRILFWGFTGSLCFLIIGLVVLFGWVFIRDVIIK